MHNILLTCLQLFGIGVGFGIVGPCLVGCMPFIIAYIVGKQANRRDAIGDIIIFLSGRFFAYLVLGLFAGISGVLLKRWSNVFTISLLRSLGGAFIIMLGVFIWIARDPVSNVCRCMNNEKINFGSLFLMGFIIGILPCAPLLALLFEVALISETAWSGMFYVMFFALGTLCPGLLS